MKGAVKEKRKKGGGDVGCSTHPHFPYFHDIQLPREQKIENNVEKHEKTNGHYSKYQMCLRELYLHHSITFFPWNKPKELTLELHGFGPPSLQ